MDNNPMNNVIFQEKITSPSPGNIIPIEADVSSITIEFETQGMFTAFFETQGITGKFYPIVAINLGTYESSISALDNNNLYQIPTVGLIAVRVNITSVTSELTVYGNIRG